MASLRHIANCIGLPARFSVIGDFYGYITGAPGPLSLLQQLRLLQGPHIHLNLICVGVESFTDFDMEVVDRKVQAAREIYATVNLGIGRVLWFIITTAEANGREHIGSTSEAEDLTEEWTVDNDALDVFVVLIFAGVIAGYSAIGGSCDKNSKGITGVVVDTELWYADFTLAHEIGHYLGLGHSTDRNNIMFKGQVTGMGILTASQGATMRGHCFVKPGCPES
mgnify:CR=1 FL=1